MPVLYNLYRHRGVDEWAIRVRGDQVEIRQGTRGARAAYEAIDRDRCMSGDPAAEMARREKDIVRDGYLYHGQGDFPNDLFRRVGRSNVSRLFLYWAARGTISRDAFGHVAEYLVEVFSLCGEEAEVRRADFCDRPTLVVSTPDGRWGVRLDLQNRLRDWHKDPYPRIRRAQGTLPVLALLYLQAAFPSALELTCDLRAPGDGEAPQPRMAPYDYWLGDEVSPYERTSKIGAALGIPPHPLLRLRPLPVLAADACLAPVWF